MRTLALTLTVTLGLTSALQARDSLSFQGPDISGKWFITAFVETEGHTGDSVFPVTFSVLSDTHVWASTTHRTRGFCYDMDVVLEKTSRPGTYTASRGKTHVDVEELPAKDHLVFYCEGPFEAGRASAPLKGQHLRHEMRTGPPLALLPGACAGSQLVPGEALTEEFSAGEGQGSLTYSSCPPGCPLRPDSPGTWPAGRNPEVNPEALEAFKKFVQRKGFSLEDVFTPEQTGQGHQAPRQPLAAPSGPTILRDVGGAPGTWASPPPAPLPRFLAQPSLPSLASNKRLQRPQWLCLSVGPLGGSPWGNVPPDSQLMVTRVSFLVVGGDPSPASLETRDKGSLYTGGDGTSPGSPGSSPSHAELTSPLVRPHLQVFATSLTWASTGQEAHTGGAARTSERDALVVTSLETRRCRGDTAVSSIYILLSPEAERLRRTPTTCVASLAVHGRSQVLPSVFWLWGHT
nr:PREDICTED: uncharacterized protein LOC106700650 [Bos mutus]